MVVNSRGTDRQGNLYFQAIFFQAIIVRRDADDLPYLEQYRLR